MKMIYPASVAMFCVLLFSIISIQNNAFVKNATEFYDHEDANGLTEYWNQKLADPVSHQYPVQASWSAIQQLENEHRIPVTDFEDQTNRSANWQPVNDFFATLSVTKLTYDPNNTQTFYFCTGEGWYNADATPGAGVWKSTDGGATWNQLLSTAGNTVFNYCQDIDVHPTTSDVYVSTRQGLMRSQDGGSSFKKVLGVGYGAQRNTICDVEFTATGGVFATIGIFETLGGIYYSPSGDSGTWTKQTTGFPITGINRIELATAPSNENVAYAIPQDAGTYGIQGVYKTTDKGQHWVSLPTPGGDLNMAKKQAWYDLVLAVDPNDENTVIAGGWTFWKSTDGGQNWLRLNHGKYDSLAYQYVHVDEHAILFQNSDTVLFGNDGGIWRANHFTDSLPIIKERDYSYRVTQFYACDIDPTAGSNIIIGGAQDNGSHMMPWQGISNYSRLSWADGGYCAINYNNPNIIYTSKNSNGIYRRTQGNGGVIDTITNPYLTDNDVEFINPFAMDPNDPDMLYMCSHYKGLWRLKNASTAVDSDWTQACINGGLFTCIGISKSQPNTVFVGRSGGGNIYRIENADTTTATHPVIDCDPANIMNNGYCNNIYVDPNDVNHVFVCFTNYNIKNIYESKNATAPSPVWTALDGDLPNVPVHWICPHPTDSNVVYIATEIGVFYTDSLNGDSTHWVIANNGLPNIRCTMLKFRNSDNKLLVSTYGRGMFWADVPVTGSNHNLVWEERGPIDVGGRTRAIMIDPNDPTHQTVWVGSVSGGLWKVTNIDGLQPASVPQITQTDSWTVYPNPVSDGGIHVSLNLKNISAVTLTLYDLNGHLISTILENQKIETGKSSYFWVPGNTLSNGIYFLVISLNGKQEVKKIVYQQ